MAISEWFGSHGLLDKSKLSRFGRRVYMFKKYDSFAGTLITSQSTRPRCLRLGGKSETLIFEASMKQCFISNFVRFGHRSEMFSRIAGLTDSWCMRFRWLRNPPMDILVVFSWKYLSSFRNSAIEKGFEVVSTLRHKLWSEATDASRPQVRVRLYKSGTTKYIFKF